MKFCLQIRIIWQNVQLLFPEVAFCFNFGVKFSLEDLLRVKDLTFCNSVSGSIKRTLHGKNIHKLFSIPTHPCIAVTPSSHVIEIAACLPVGPQLQVTRHPDPFN